MIKIKSIDTSKEFAKEIGKWGLIVRILNDAKMQPKRNSDFPQITDEIIAGINNEIEKNNSKIFEEKNVIDFPLQIFKNEYGFLNLASDENDEDEIIYSLFMANDSNTGKVSIQYRGEDGTFLTQKQVLKVLKRENEVGKFWKVIK